MPTLRTLHVLAAVSLLAALRPPSAFAQLPETFTNLQVLPKDIPREELVATMRAMTAGLGVRCTHCHVVVSEQPEKIDFASDEKEGKQVARGMLRMVRRINAELVDTVPASDAARQQVTCYTCHRRSQKPPRPLQELMLESVAAGGVPAAIDRYRHLRQESLDAGLYDFREHTLTIAARQLRDQKKFDEAIAMLRFNAEIFSSSAGVQASLGEAAALAGDLALARASYRKALELDPAHAAAKRGLAELDHKAPSRP